VRRAAQIGHLAQAAALELAVADGEYLVDDDDVRFEMRGDREGQSQLHARRVGAVASRHDEKGG